MEEQGISPFITRQLNTENNEYTYNVDQDIFSNPQKRILESGGDYDAIGGIVSNFSYTLREDGGFDCTTIITSMGASLFHKPIDVSGNILGTRKQTLNGKLKYAPSDNLVNCVLNLRNIIMYDYLKVKREVYSNTVSDKNPAGVGHKSQEHKHLLTEKKDENTAKYMIYSQSDNVYGFKVNEKGNAYGLAVDDRDNPNVLVAIRPDDKEDIFVTWGWFEDQILNRYLSFNGGSEDGAGVKLTMRSIDTVLDENGKPISTQDLELGSLDFEEEDELVERYGVNLDIDQFNSVLKKPSVIRAPEMLYSVEPFKFFTVDIDLPKGKDNIKGLNTEKSSTLETGSARIQKAIDIVSNITPATGLLRSAYKYITKDEGLGERGGKFYERFLNLLNGGGDFTDKVFKTPGTRQGVLRNVYMNIKEIQKAFGIKDPNNLKDTTQNNITPPGTIEVGVKNLLRLNSNFHNV